MCTILCLFLTLLVGLVEEKEKCQSKMLIKVLITGSCWTFNTLYHIYQVCHRVFRFINAKGKPEMFVVCFTTCFV